MSTSEYWNEEDYPSSGDEARNDRIRRSRERHTNRNVERVRNAITTPDSQTRGFVAALNTIREDPNVRAQLQRIEEIWTLKHDKALADVLYTEVTLAIVQAANAVAAAGKNVNGEDEEHFAARHAARSRTVGNFQWTEPSASSPSETAQSTSASQQSQQQLDVVTLKVRAA